MGDGLFRRTGSPLNGGTYMSQLRAEKTGNGRQVCWIPMNEIHPNPTQPRQIFDDVKLMELASSIRRHGLLQPITLRL